MGKLLENYNTEGLLARPSRCCRFCRSELKQTFVDLGMVPLANNNLTSSQLADVERFYPLRAYVCAECLLVQLEQMETPEKLFTEYPYFSSYSEIWLHHARVYVEMVVERFGIEKESKVVEIGSNDGYLLQYFIKKGIAAFGIEPAANVAEAAVKAGIPTVVRFFGEDTARELRAEDKQADLLIGNNVLAHVPDLNDFIGGLRILLKPRGVITLEFPHLIRLMAENQFDTIYHEHFSYFSFTTANKIFAAHGLTVFDVEELSTHGGSLRIYVRHSEDASKSISQRVNDLLSKEEAEGFTRFQHYLTFAESVKETKRQLLEFLIGAKRKGRSIAGYGAPAKGNTLLNYCGIRSDFIDYTVDRSPHKQGHFLPGTHIPICHPNKIKETMPDYVLILPWNIKEEIMEQMAHVREWGGQFVVPIPELRVFP